MSGEFSVTEGREEPSETFTESSVFSPSVPARSLVACGSLAAVSFTSVVGMSGRRRPRRFRRRRRPWEPSPPSSFTPLAFSAELLREFGR